MISVSTSHSAGCTSHNSASHGSQTHGTTASIVALLWLLAPMILEKSTSQVTYCPIEFTREKLMRLDSAKRCARPMVCKERCASECGLHGRGEDLLMVETVESVWLRASQGEKEC